MDEHAPRLADLVAAVPWLATVPSDLAERLDRSEYVLAPADLQLTRGYLERVLAAYVMTYRRHRAGPRTGTEQLCRLVVPAVLDARGLLELRRAEERFPDVLFCAYARPLRLHDGSGSG